ncbi:R3H domain-containing protein 4 isoform X1 [Anabrus simplex]|uniref:R3H domain-containing protein 4 isoform X1 n=1 Tax=Anabrus simplex TaxID=316456 RepID=UPI0035A3C8D6
MGVISKNDRKIGRFGSDSSESLHIPHLSEEDEDVGSGSSDIVPPPVNPRTLNRHRRRVRPIPISFGSPRRRPGKKRNRRYENVSQLETLVEDEELTEISISDFIPEASRGFSSLFENEDAMQVWEEFVNTPEDQQDQILSRRKEASGVNVQLQSDLIQTGEVAYRRISSGLRNKLKRCRVPLGIVEPIENELIDFFTKAPTSTYISGILNSFERLLLHAVAQYYGLIARSIDLVADNLRVVKISNPCAVFRKPCIMLVEYLDKKRNSPFH